MRAWPARKRHADTDAWQIQGRHGATFGTVGTSNQISHKSSSHVCHNSMHCLSNPVREQIVCSQTYSDRQKDTHIINCRDWWKSYTGWHIIFTVWQYEVRCSQWFRVHEIARWIEVRIMQQVLCLQALDLHGGTAMRKFHFVLCRMASRPFQEYLELRLWLACAETKRKDDDMKSSMTV